MKEKFKIPMLLMTTLISLFLTTVSLQGCVGKGGNQSSGSIQGSQDVRGTLSIESCDYTAVVGEKEINLPDCKAASANGEDISNLVVITDSLNSVIDKGKGTIVLKEDGVHTITYSVIDPFNQQTLSRSFTVTRYREIFNFYNLDGEISQYAENAQQYCTSLNAGQGISCFNLSASNLYYAEVYFNATTATRFWEGLAHVESVGEGADANKWLASLVDTTDGMKHKFYTDENYSFVEVANTSVATNLTVGQAFKYAIARYKTTFYAFINDELVAKYTNESMEKVLTAPGIFTVAEKNGDFVTSGGLKISNIDYFKGIAAKDKIVALTGQKFGSDIEIDVGGTNWGDYDTPLN